MTRYDTFASYLAVSDLGTAISVSARRKLHLVELWVWHLGGSHKSLQKLRKEQPLETLFVEKQGGNMKSSSISISLLKWQWKIRKSTQFLRCIALHLPIDEGLETPAMIEAAASSLSRAATLAADREAVEVPMMPPMLGIPPNGTI